eukprot:IDg1785t1
MYWEDKEAQHALIFRMRVGNDEGSTCCRRWMCIRVLHEEDINRALDDTAAMRDAGPHVFRMYVRTLFLCSLKLLEPSAQRVRAAKSVGMYRHPAVLHGMCQRMFCLLLGIAEETLRRMKPDVQGRGRFIATPSHGSTSNRNAEKPAAREYFVNCVQEIAKQYGHPQPWPLPGLSEHQEVLVLPPQFTVNRMYSMIIETAATAQALSKSSFYSLFNSFELEHIHISGTERGSEWVASFCGRFKAPSRGTHAKDIFWPAIGSLAVQFVVETPFDTSVVPPAGTIECVMFDYVSSHKTPHKAQETFAEFFLFSSALTFTCSWYTMFAPGSHIS